MEIEALKAELKREQKKNAKLKAKHEADKVEIKNLRRRKKSNAKSLTGPIPTAARSKKKLAEELKAAGLNKEQSKLAQDILEAIVILKR